jgi:hypothetical protein
MVVDGVLAVVLSRPTVVPAQCHAVWRGYRFRFARRMKVKWVWTRGALLVRVRVGAGDDELKRRVWD